MHSALATSPRKRCTAAFLAACALILGPVAGMAGAEYDVFWPEDCREYDDVAACIQYYCDAYWDLDGYYSHHTCVTDLDYLAGGETYKNVYLPEDCHRYDDMSSCIQYYCDAYWELDGFDSYYECRSNPFSYDDGFYDVLWPEACESYDDADACMEYYCSSYWDLDGFDSYSECVQNPLAYVNPYTHVSAPDDCDIYVDVQACLYHYCSVGWSSHGFDSYHACLDDMYAEPPHLEEWYGDVY